MLRKKKLNGTQKTDIILQPIPAKTTTWAWLTRDAVLVSRRYLHPQVTQRFPFNSGEEVLLYPSWRPNPAALHSSNSHIIRSRSTPITITRRSSTSRLCMLERLEDMPSYAPSRCSPQSSSSPRLRGTPVTPEQAATWINDALPGFLPQVPPGTSIGHSVGKQTGE